MRCTPKASKPDYGHEGPLLVILDPHQHIAPLHPGDSRASHYGSQFQRSQALHGRSVVGGPGRRESARVLVDRKEGQSEERGER